MAYKEQKRKLIISLIAIMGIILFSFMTSAIVVDSVASREISIATMSDKIYSVAYVSEGNISYAIFNTNGTTLVPKVNILSNVSVNARVQARAINSSTFIVSWYSDTSKGLFYQLFNVNGNNISSVQFMETIGTATTDRVDLSIAPDINNAYIGYINDVTDDSDLRNFTYSGLGGGTDTILDATNNIAQPMFQYVSATIINSTRLGYWYNDDADNDATFILVNTQTNSIISSTDRDGNMGNGQIRGTSMYSNLTAGLWFDQSDSNIYFEILNRDGGDIYSATSQDNNAGADSRVAITTTKRTDNNQSVFIIGWNDRSSDSIEARVLSDNGTLIYNYTLATDEQTTNLFFALQGRNDYLNAGICNGTYIFAYTNTTGSIIAKQLYINGTESDGLCNADLINPNATLLQPIDNLYTNITGVNFTINATDNVALSNITLFIYNGTALITQQTQAVSGKTGIFGIFYNFLVNDVFTWFYKVVDVAGNIFTTENRTIVVDTVYPQLAIQYPVDTANYDYVVSNITHSVNETNLANCTFSNTTFTTPITCNAPYYFNASENTNMWVITATDLAGQSYAKPTTFIVDTIYPQINFSSGTPPNNTISMSGTGYVNVTINETNFYSINYLVANSTTIIHDITFYTPITSVLFVNQSENIYYYNVTIEDVVGHRATTETRIYIVDKTAPSLVVHSPVGVNYTNNLIFINITSDGTETFYTNGAGIEEYTSPVFKIYPEGFFNFTAIAEDEAGNQNITNFQFFVDSLAPNITYISPTEANNSIKATNTVRVNVNVIEASFVNLTINLYNSTQSEIASSISNITPHFVEFTNLSNGIYYFNVTACDVFSICSSAETRKVTINQGLLGSLELSLIVPQYPYVDVNVTYPVNVELNVGDIVVNDAVVNFTLTLTNGTQISSIMPYNSTTGYYGLSLIFDEVGDFPFTITANSSSFGFVSESGTFIARVPFYLTIQLYEQGTLDQIENDFAYITAEYVGTRRIDGLIEPFIYPIADNRFVAKSFHAQYINGEAYLKLYEPQTDYVFRYFDGVVNFDGEYSAPNVTKSYGTEVYLGTQYVNGTDSLYQFVLSQKDLKPYFWLFNWILVILLVLVGVGSLAMFFFFPDKPQIALIFGVLFTFVLIGIRVTVYLWMGQ